MSQVHRWWLGFNDKLQKFRTSKKEWQEFGAYVRDLVATIVKSLEIVDVWQTEIRDRLGKLQSLV